jgi:hypothetical protein
MQAGDEAPNAAPLPSMATRAATDTRAALRLTERHFNMVYLRRVAFQGGDELNRAARAAAVSGARDDPS